jgi:hypothetical protein
MITFYSIAIVISILPRSSARKLNKVVGIFVFILQLNLKLRKGLRMATNYKNYDKLKNSIERRFKMRNNRNFFIVLALIVSSFIFLGSNLVFAENNATLNSSSCDIPDCEGAYIAPNAGVLTNGCQPYICPRNTTTNRSEGDMDSCLDNSDNYWDQETNQCYHGFSKEIKKSACSDSDGGMEKYLQAHTFGFRSYSSSNNPSRDLRIRTGGKDGCINKKELAEHYCDENGFIKTVYLDCANGCQSGACVKGEEVREEVICNFKGSEAGDECYLAGSSLYESTQGRTWCKGTESQPCKVEVSAEEGDKLTWKSSCGGYKYTIQDGTDESIVFDCSQGETSTNESLPENNAFRNAYWQCYNGKEFNLGGDSSCKPYGLWKKYATEACDAKCSSGREKCGVISFALTNPCYSDYDGEKNSGSTSNSPSQSDCEEYAKECKMNNQQACDKWNFNCNKPGETNVSLSEAVICKDSCPLDGKCFPFGYRKSGKFCSDIGSFVEQLEADKVCENNFECSSNVCVSGTCVSEGLLKKVLNWFKNLFS